MSSFRFFRTSKVFGKQIIKGIDSCLTFCSLLESFACSELISICDNATIVQQGFFASRSGYFYRTKKGNAGSFRLVVELSALHSSTIVYFVEDDHLHRPLQKQFIC